jgi:hypothetical protein
VLQALNEDGKKVGKLIMFNGKKVPLTLFRFIFQLDHETCWPVDTSKLLENGETSREMRTKSKRASAPASRGNGPQQPIQPEDICVQGATKVFVEQIAAVRGSSFDANALYEPIKQPGRYGMQPILARACLEVRPGFAQCNCSSMSTAAEKGDLYTLLIRVTCAHCSRAAAQSLACCAVAKATTSPSCVVPT